MNPNSKKIILFSFIGIIAIGFAVAYYLFSKGPQDIKNANGLPVAAAVLYESFSSDSANARKKFGDQILEVSGKVQKISENQQKQQVVLLETSQSGAFVNCTMEEGNSNMKENEHVTLKGICTGMGMGDVDLGILGDVYLVRCYVAN